MSDNKTPLLQHGIGGTGKSAEISSHKEHQPPDAQLPTTMGQFLHLLRLLLRVKLGYRGIFLLGVALLMHYNLFRALISNQSTKITKHGMEILKFYSMSDFVSSGAKVLIDRSEFPVECDTAATIVSGKGGSTSWMKDCSSETACRAEFISESDPSVVAYFRYSKNYETRRHILECFRVKDAAHRCAILYQLMVQSSFKEKWDAFEFKNLQVFSLKKDVMEESAVEESKKVESGASICEKWSDRDSFSGIIVEALRPITIGLSFYFLLTTISFIRIVKMGGFYQQLIRNGLSVTYYWAIILLATFSECILFALLFVLSHVLPCPGIYSAGGIARVFGMLTIFFIELAAAALLLEILIPSMVAVSVLLLIAGVVLNLAYNSYKGLHDFSTIGSLLPPIHVMEYTKTYMTSGASSGNYSSAAILIDSEHVYDNMLIANIIAAALLILTTTYVDFLLPSGNGLCLMPSFPFIPRFWWKPAVSTGVRGKNADGKDASSDEKFEPHIEPVVGATPSIIVDKVSKTYKCCPCSAQGTRVLQQLSCKIYKNQITALIGHNGAGKSTLIKILSGDENPDSGSAHIDDIEVTDPIERLALRGSISVCPQFNILCESLSVIECIQITLTSKGISGHSELERARSLLKRLGLGDKENVMSTDLSGGQKRKMSTILALLGDPKVVFLDEPTSGLDPVSRRQLWQLLQEQKLGRSIVLCTQFMDEADILADRKIFLCGGNIVCAGSSMFLKRAFGCSFTISVSLKSETDAQKLLSRLKEVQLKSQLKTELQLEIPASKPNVLIAAVEALEGASEIVSFGLSQANLDDVFMRLSGVRSTEVIDAFRSGNLSKLQDKPSSDAMEKGKMELTQLLAQPVKLAPSTFVQFRAMLCVNLRKQWRTSTTFWGRYVVSAAILALMALSSFNLNKANSMGSGSKTKNSSESVTVDETVDLNNRQVDSTGVTIGARRSSIFSFRSYHYSEEEPDSLNVVCIYDEGFSLESFNQQCSRLFLFGKGLAPSGNWELFENFSSTISKPQEETLESFLQKKSTREKLRQMCKVDTDSCSTRSCETCVLYYSSTWSIDELNSQRKIAIGVFIPESKVDTVHAFRRAMNKIWHYFGAEDVKSITALAGIPPLSQTFQKDYDIVSLILVFCLFPVSYLSDPIEDITSRVRNQLLSMGMSYLAYWINLFSLHWVQYSVCFQIAVGIVFVMEKYRNWGYFAHVVLPVMFLGTTSNQLTMYVVANVTRTTNTTVILICNIVAVGIAYTLDLFFDVRNTTLILTLITLVPPIAPTAMLLFGLLPAQYSQAYYSADSIGNTPGAFDNYWNYSYVLRPMIMMPVHIVFLLGVLVLSEYKQKLRRLFNALVAPKRTIDKKDPEQVDQGGSADQGAQMEHNRLMQNEQNADNVLEVRQLSKIYPNGVHAVKGVTFGVMSGEIFGLLGANGAGKSTSMSVIVGEEAETGGSVEVRSQDGRWSSGRSGAAMGVIGYCPQHNPLFDFITVQEHLALYAAIRGVPANVVQLQADALMKGLGLQQHKDKRSSELSGGNKRRLCLAIALLGDPMLIVIDEASTGVDPENKRFIWGAIRGMLKEQRAIMLTTHSMEEVEALCNRVAIMNRGRIIAFGTVQQMLSQHGDAFTLDVLFASDGSVQQKKAAVKSAVKAHFKNAVLLEDLGLCAQFALPKKSVGSLSGALKWLGANQTKLGMLSYSLCQMSLDQVFVKLLKKYDSISANPD